MFKTKAAPKYTRSFKSSISKQRERKRVNYKKYIFMFLVYLLIALISLAAFNTTRLLLIKPKQSSLSNSAQNRLLIQRDDLNSTLIIFEDDSQKKILGAWYVLNNKKNGFSMVYWIPPRVYMKEYLNKVSEYVSVGDLPYVGDAISAPRSHEYALWQLNNLTGMTADSYIWVNMKSLTSYSKLFSDVSEYKESDYSSLYTENNDISSDLYMVNSFFSKISFIKMFFNIEESKVFISNIDTNLNQFELLARFTQVSKILKHGNIYVMDLGRLWATLPQLTVTGKDINVVNYGEVDSRLKSVVKDLKGREIEREQVKIEIYNASEIDGMASRYSRKFENSGIDVIRYENSPMTYDRTTIYAPNATKFAKSLEVVKKLVVVNSEIVNGRPQFMTTADIVVVLGKDLDAEANWH